MILFVNVMFEYESFEDWSWLRTGGGGGGGGGGCGEPVIHPAAYITFPYSCVRLGFSNQKVESREGLDIALMASFTPTIGISILWCSRTITIDEHNDIIRSWGYHNNSKTN